MANSGGLLLEQKSSLGGIGLGARWHTTKEMILETIWMVIHIRKKETFGKTTFWDRMVRHGRQIMYAVNLWLWWKRMGNGKLVACVGNYFYVLPGEGEVGVLGR